jgi:hypothetical protein
MRSMGYAVAEPELIHQARRGGARRRRGWRSPPGPGPVDGHGTHACRRRRLATRHVTEADAEPAFVAIILGVVTEPQASR